MNPKIYNVLWEKCVIGLAEVDRMGRFVRANPTFCNLIGYSEAELQEKSWRDITHPEDTDGYQTMFDRSLDQTIHGYSMEKRYLTKRGQIVWVSLHVTSIVDDNGDIKYLLKQVTNNTIIIPTPVADCETKRSPMKENYKAIMAAIAGVMLTMCGAFLKNSEVQNIGIAITLGIFGGIISSKKH